MKRLHHSALDGGVEINEDIPAAHEVQPREGWVAGHILTRKDAQVPYAFGDAIVIVLLYEETREALGRDLLRDGIQVDTARAFSIAGSLTSVPKI